MHSSINSSIISFPGSFWRHFVLTHLEVHVDAFAVLWVLSQIDWNIFFVVVFIRQKEHPRSLVACIKYHFVHKTWKWEVFDFHYIEKNIRLVKAIPDIIVQNTCFFKLISLRELTQYFCCICYVLSGHLDNTFFFGLGMESAMDKLWSGDCP